MPDTRLHIAHFHETKRVASASVLAALQAGIKHFEGTKRNEQRVQDLKSWDR